MKKGYLLVAVLFVLPVMAAGPKVKHSVVQLQVTEKGFEPDHVTIKPGTKVTLMVTRKTDSTCGTAISIPSKKIKKDLPLNQTVSIDLGVLAKGELNFSCGMNMLRGQIIVQEVK
jgi:plastocyanin domain-containing protein